MAALLFLARLAHAESCEPPAPDVFDQARDFVAAVSSFIGSLIPIAMLIPGPEPERTLTRIRDMLAKHSRK